MQSFYRLPTANSMATALDIRLRDNQRRDKPTVLEVLRVEPRQLVERWTAQLCAAVAWLESLGLTHNDPAPRQHAP
jgi:atypical protein kinase C zeta type